MLLLLTTYVVVSSFLLFSPYMSQVNCRILLKNQIKISILPFSLFSWRRYDTSFMNCGLYNIIILTTCSRWTLFYLTSPKKCNFLEKKSNKIDGKSKTHSHVKEFWRTISFVHLVHCWETAGCFLPSFLLNDDKNNL